MAGILSQLTSDPLIRQFAAGLAGELVSPTADFIAPTVTVASSIGRYKKYFGAESLRIPDTRRGVEGKAAKVSFSAADGTYNCEHHALDFPADMIARIESEEMGLNLLRQGALVASQIAALSHEDRVITAAIAAAGAATTVNVNTTDPIDSIDTQVRAVALACGGFAGIMKVRIVLGLGALQILKNSEKVRSRYVSAGGVASTAIPNISEAQLSSLIITGPEVRTSLAVKDSAKTGAAATDLDWIMENDILVFAASDQTSEFDPSFMKTFRLANQWMVPRAYTSDDGRVEYQGWDWSADVAVSNSGAIKRLTLTAAAP